MNDNDSITSKGMERPVEKKSGSEKATRHQNLVVTAIGFLISSAVTVVVIVLAVTLPNDSGDAIPPEQPEATQSPSTAPGAIPLPTLQNLEHLKGIVTEKSLDSGAALLNESTPQHEALMWLAIDPNVDNYSDVRIVQRHVLATLYFSTSGDDWDTFLATDDRNLTHENRWLSDKDECTWYTSTFDKTRTCNENGNIVEINLTNSNLKGASLPPEVALLSNSLEILSLKNNQIQAIPTELGLLHSIVQLDVSENYLYGKIPTELALMKNLESLNLNENYLTGMVPTEFGSLSKLTNLDLALNDLTGSVPNEVCGQYPATVNVDCSEVWCKCCGENCLKESLSFISSDFGLALSNESSPQHSAYIWVESDPNVAEYSTKRLIQRYALTTFFYCTSGEQWFVNENWLSERHECEWRSVECDRDGNVVELQISSNNLIGTIPQELGLLTNMKHMSLASHTLLKGTIPTETGLVSSLQLLQLSDTQLTGPIPTEIMSVSNLTFLNLERNRLDGSIPTDLGRMSKLKNIGLSGNPLHGNIPSEIGLLTTIEYLSFGNNSLSGFIPTELGLLTGIRNLDLAHNEFYGHIPTEIATLINMESITLNSNKISGKIPSELGLTGNLRYLVLANNQLTGSIPKEIALLTGLEQVFLDDNLFTGSVPFGLCNLTNLHTLEIDCNRVICGCCGTPCLVKYLSAVSPNSGVALLDDSSPQHAALNWLASDPDLKKYPGTRLIQRYVYATLYYSTKGDEWFVNDGWLGHEHECEWASIDVNECDKNGNTVNLWMKANNMVGTLPPELGLLSFLQFLKFPFNDLTGYMPAEIAKVTSLRGFDLSANKLAGEIFTDIGLLVNMEQLSLSGNNFKGLLPSEMGLLTGIQSLRLVDVGVSGPIPKEFFSLSELKFAELGHNGFNGPLPTELQSLTSLEHIDLSYNALSGNLPSETGLLTGIKTLRVHENLLSGKVPSEMALLTSLEYLDLTGNRLTGSLPDGVCELSSLGIIGVDCSEVSCTCCSCQ